MNESLELGSSMDYTFNSPVDLSVIGYHDLVVTTMLPGDANVQNDSASATIINTLCQPSLLCEQGVGIFVFELKDIYNDTGCDPDGYGNYTNMMENLSQGSSNDLTVTTGYGNVYVKVWIDFNDNFVFDPDEVIVSDYLIAAGQGAGSYTETMALDIPDDASLGEHLLRIKTNYNEPVPADACESTMFGESEDYMVNITLETGLSHQDIEPNELIIFNTGNNQFVASFQAIHINEPLIVSIHNLQGQRVIHNRVHNVSGKYKYDFDMSYAAPGIYLLRLGSSSFGKVKRFVFR